MDPKLLTEAGWKTTAAKFKIKDNGLQRALADYQKVEDDDHDGQIEAIEEITKLASTLKKTKEVAAAAAVAKYLGELLGTAESQQREVAKAKAVAMKTEAMTRKKAEAEAKEQGEDDEEEEEESDYPKRLLQAFQKLKGAKNLAYPFLVCDAKPFCAVMVAKRITPKHKPELTELTGGSKRFLKPGMCSFQDGKYTFVMDEPIPGLARKLQLSIKNFTGKKLPIVIGDETAEEGDEELGGGAKKPLENAINPDLKRAQEAGPAAAGPGSIAGSVGRGGKNNPGDVQAIQKALNAKMKTSLAVDGKCGPQVIAAIEAFQKALGQMKPDGRIDPGRGTARALANPGPLPPTPAAPQPVAMPKLGKPALAKAPEVWHGMRKIVDTNIEQVKKAVRGHYAHEHPDLVKQIDEKLVDLDGITEKLDHRIADSLAKANAAKDEAARKAELKNAKAILADYIQYVKSEPLIAHIDTNPWVKVDLKKTLVDTITHMAQSIGS
jgi:hypothetical protein